MSEQGEGRVGHHSDYIEVIPDYLLEIPEKYDVEIDIMIEAKAKEKAIMKLYQKYPFMNCKRMKVKKLIRKKKQQETSETTWNSIIEDLFSKEQFSTIKTQLKADEEHFKIYPPENMRFNAFNYFNPIKTRVVVIGQDPYHQEGQGNGLAFSVNDGVKHPPSLKNIFKEIYSDLQADTKDIITCSGNLEYLAKQGVLLLNTTLSVRDSKPNSHVKIWSGFIVAVLNELLKLKNKGIVFMVWGGNAQSVIDKLKKSNENCFDNHTIIKCNHPSPLSANRGGWFNTKPFSRCNEYLSGVGEESIDWLGV